MRWSGSARADAEGRARHGRGRARRVRASRLGAVGAAIICAFGGLSTATAPKASAGWTEKVIVTTNGILSPAQAVLEVGGTVLSTFHIINGVVASILTASEPVLAALPGVEVTPDLSVTIPSAVEADGPHVPSDAFLPETGATALAAAGDTGQGVTVAVLDTGIDNLPDFAGRLAGGVDLSGGNNPYQDGYGHGTFIAGLVAGNGASSNGQYSGEAPAAKLVSIKVAGASGSTDLATLIYGLQWAADNRGTYGIKVLNISFGVRTGQSALVNPLDQAVEAVWNSGITVVAAAGNAGPFNGTILSPGDDPLVITTGALDDEATPSTGDDQMTTFSSAGPTSPDGWVKPDLVAPGRSVVSLAAPGSTIASSYPSARVSPANFVGSGTSFSAAITSGAAALVLADHPDLTPDQLKARLLGNTSPGPVGNPFVDGHGALNAAAAAQSGPMDLAQSVAGLVPVSLGTTVSLSPDGPADTWNLSLWTGLSVSGSAVSQTWNGWCWDGSDWNGWTWTGKAWNNDGWTGSQWNGQDWTGKAWNNAGWTGSSWSGSAWDSSAWNGSSWN